MPIEAPLSKYKRNNLKIYIVVCMVVALWFGYDGYLNKTFIAKHTDEAGHANSTLIFNRVAPPFSVAGAVLLGAYFWVIRGRKVVALEDRLVIAGKTEISYDAIEKIDKTHFDTRGQFTVVYTGGNGREVRQTLSERQYDNLRPILDHLVAQIS